MKRRIWVPWRGQSATWKVVSASGAVLLFGSLALRLMTDRDTFADWIMGAGFVALFFRPMLAGAASRRGSSFGG